MASGYNIFMLIDVNFDGTFAFDPLRYENEIDYQMAVRKDLQPKYETLYNQLLESTQSTFFHQLFFKLPECELEYGLKLIANDIDLEIMFDYARQYDNIQMYIAHGPQDLSRFYEANLTVGISPEYTYYRNVTTKHAGNMSYDELVSWAEEDAVETASISTGPSSVGQELVPYDFHAHNTKVVVDKGKGIMLNEPNKTKKKPRTRSQSIIIRENVNSNLPDDSDSLSDSDYDFETNGWVDSDTDCSEKSLDYVSECEEELRSHRKRHIEAKKNPQKKRAYMGCAIPNDGYDAGENDTVRQHELYMETLMHTLSGQQNGLGDPFALEEYENSTENFPIHDPKTHWKMRKPKVSERYMNADQLKECLTYYSLANGFSLWFPKSSKTELIAKCGKRPEKLNDTEQGKQRKQCKYPSTSNNELPECKFRCYGRLMNTENSFQVISLNEQHTCVRNFKYGNLVNYKWIAKNFGHKIRENPDIKLCQIAAMVLKKYKCLISPNQARAAKRKALNEGDITIGEHYALIRSYGKAILDYNVGSTVKLGVTVNPDDKTYFDRFYCCFNGLKKGFQLGCRPVIALDGCFLKKPFVGEILTAVGRDANNHIYPVAWAVVNVENKDNWSWFLELLGEDIGMPTGNGLSLISDQHKGLIEAVKDVMPLAEHRQCARHIYEGFRKQYSGVEFRELFWQASKASYPQLFNKIMAKIKRANPGAYDYLVKKDPKTWSRAFFRLGSNCESVENGFSECFNSVLLHVRDKPLITILESMRVIVMERLNTMRVMSQKWTGDICPNIQKRLELNKDKHRYWHVVVCGGNVYEVRNGSEAFKVDEEHRTCTCRMWQLSGLPCPHSIAVMFKINKTPEDYIPACFRKEAFNKAYHQYMIPLGGMDFWPDSNMYSTVLAPKPRAMPGRPRKKRTRAPHERELGNRVSRVGAVITCQNCLETGHNKSSCKKPKVNPSQPQRRGQPRRTNTVRNRNESNAQPSHENENDDFVHVRCEQPIGRGRGSDVQSIDGISSGRGRARGTITYGRGMARGTTTYGRGMARGTTTDGIPFGRGRARGRARGMSSGPQTVGVKYGRLAQWFGIGAHSNANDTSAGTPPTQESQAGANPFVRPRSARLMEKRTTASFNGAGSSGTNNHG